MTTYEVRHERRPVSFLRHYEPNPRRLRNTAAFVALCRSIVAFGLAQTICALDDGRVLGGNQTLDALAQLKRGFDAPRLDDTSKTERIQWEPPGGEVDVMLVCGATPEQAKALNLALNRHAGEDVEDEVAKVLRELRDTAPDLLGAIDTDEEIARLLADDEGDDAAAGGDAPKTKGVPSITLQFTSAGAHTRVKQALAAAAKKYPAKDGEKTSSGDLLDHVLAEGRPEKAKKNGKAATPAKTRARA